MHRTIRHVHVLRMFVCWLPAAFSVTMLKHMSILCLCFVYILDYTGPTPTITTTTTTTTTASLNVISTTGAARSFSTSTTTSVSSGSKACSGDIHSLGFLQYFCLTCRCGLILNAQPLLVFFIKAAILFFRLDFAECFIHRVRLYKRRPTKKHQFLKKRLNSSKRNFIRLFKGFCALKVNLFYKIRLIRVLRRSGNT